MSDVITSRSLASQALSNLVNQFARPLDFLRELVQNSLDAGSPRVEVAVGWEGAPDASEGIATIHVDDFGEGMDEHVIDEQLTRLFSSTKEDDLTKIGKFGIGFTSIFAIRPEAVLVHTGRHGEFWELLFHPDRSFDKVRVDKPVTGTRITLFKRMPRDERDAFVREVRYVLTYWCEHSHTPITFEDRTASPQASTTAATSPSTDAFAAFATPQAAATSTTQEAISRPFALDGAALTTAVHAEDLEVLVGATDDPRYGYYNGGLTLVNSVNREVLGTFAERLGHLAFKVRSDALEHTLTRDNVLQDAAWQGVMRRVVEVADTLRDELLDRAVQAVADGEDVSRWHALLVRELPAAPGRAHPFQVRLREQALFLGHHEPLSLSALERQERRLGRMLLHPGDGPLADALDDNQILLVRPSAPTHALLQAAEPPRVLGLLPQTRRLVDARSRFVLPQLVPLTELPADERRLFERVDGLLQAATGRRASLVIGEMGGSGTVDDLVVEGPRDGRLFERKGDGWLWLPTFLRWRTLLLNRHHPHVRALVAASLADPAVAALALAQACLIYEGLEGEGTFQRLFATVTADVPGVS